MKCAPFSQDPTRYLKIAALALSSGLLLAGCAGNPPSEQMAVTQTLVRDAESAGATEHAAVAMQSARENLKQAELALQKEEYEKAKRLAEKAEWDARLAEQKALATKAQLAVKEAEKGIQDLREESMRKTSTQ